MTSAKRDRLKRDASMDEETGPVTSDNVKSTGSCSTSYGIKSYLNHFYDMTGSFKDPDLYEDDQDIMLLSSPRHRSTRFTCCSRNAWNVFAVIGVGCLLAGIALIVAGMVISYQPSTQTQPPHSVGVADLCRLVGVMLFCAGGLVLAVSLLVPSFTLCRTEFDDDFHTSYSTIDEMPADLNKCSAMIKSSSSNQPPIKALLLPTTTTTLTGIQPSRLAAETRLIGDSFIPY